jgi:perosamine synthetase
MRDFIPLAEPLLDEKDVEAVAGILKSGWLKENQKVQSFENALAKCVGTKYAVMVSSGTAALHLAYIACGITENDEVIMPSLTYIATANTALYLRAKPIFADIESSTYNIDPKLIEKKIGPKTKAIVVVHWAGLPANIKEIKEIASKHNLIVIEDAAQALGATFQGKRVGSFGDAACFSFSTVKNITTGEGGAIVTDSEKIAKVCQMLRDQGQEQGRALFHEILGYNYRTTEIAAALGISQLKKLEQIIKNKQWLFGLLNENLRNDSFSSKVFPPYTPKDRTHVYTHYMLRVKNEGTFNRDVLMKILIAAGIDCRVYANPVHLQPFIKTLIPIQHLPLTEDAFNSTLCLPSPCTITHDDCEKILSKIKKAIS